MRCNFQRRMIARDHQKIIKEMAVEGACDQLADVAARAQYLWMAAMLNVGLSNRTIKRVMNQLPEVYARYGDACDDGVGDAMLLRDLRSHGIEVKAPDNEL